MKRTILAVSMAAALCAIGPGLAQPAAPASAPAPAETETVKVQAAAMPDEVVTGFVKTFTAPSQLSGKIPRWYTGICLKTQGLPREIGDAVTRRILEVARMIGAPVQEQPCTLNTVVIFDTNPQAVLDDIAARSPELLGAHDPSQVKELSKVRFPVQAWYATETQDDKGVTVLDSNEQSALCDSVDTATQVGNGGDLKGGFHVDPNRLTQATRELQQYCGHRYDTGNHLRDGIHSHIVAVTAVASMEAVRFHEMGAIADYMALVILSQTQAFERCEKMETVANLLVPRCDLDNRVTGLMPGDIAYLKALYKADTGGTLVAQQASIAAEMKKLVATEAGR